MKKQEVIDSIDTRTETTWKMAYAFLENRDAHGLMDMGAELQALERSRRELQRII